MAEVLEAIKERITPAEALLESARLRMYLSSGVYSRLVEYYAQDQVFDGMLQLIGRVPLIDWLEMNQDHLNFFSTQFAVFESLATIHEDLYYYAQHREFMEWYVNYQSGVADILSKLDVISWYAQQQPSINRAIAEEIPQLTEDISSLNTSLRGLVTAEIASLRGEHETLIGAVSSELMTTKNTLGEEIDSNRSQIAGAFGQIRDLDKTLTEYAEGLQGTIGSLKNLNSNFTTYIEEFPTRFQKALTGSVDFRNLLGSLAGQWEAITGDFKTELGAFSNWIQNMETGVENLLGQLKALPEIIGQNLGSHLSSYAIQLKGVIDLATNAQNSLTHVIDEKSISYTRLEEGLLPKPTAFTAPFWDAFSYELQELVKLGKDPKIWKVDDAVQQIFNVLSCLHAGGTDFFLDLRNSAAGLWNALSAIKTDAENFQNTILALAQKITSVEPIAIETVGEVEPVSDSDIYKEQRETGLPPPPEEPEAPAPPEEPEEPTPSEPEEPSYTYAGSIGSVTAPPLVYIGATFPVEVRNAWIKSNPTGAKVDGYIILKDDSTGKQLDYQQASFKAEGQPINVTLSTTAPTTASFKIRVELAIRNAPATDKEWTFLDVERKTIALTEKI